MPRKQNNPGLQGRTNRPVITALIITLSLILLLTGLILGDLQEGIFQKAVTICTECIGIG